MKRLYFWLLLLVSTGAAQAQLQVNGFSNYALQGFNVLVNNDALNDHPARTQEAIRYLDTLLTRIAGLGLAGDIMDSLRAVPIFMEWALTTGSAWYHPDRNWLIQNGYRPEKAKAVEIANIDNFINWSRQNQPMIVMHELAHAYHDRVLGFSHAPVFAAFNAAVASGNYSSVPYYPGYGNPPFNRPAYALTNEREYFAEITEAYLGQNDYSPFDSAALRTHDPAGYALTRSVWRWGTTSALEALPFPQIRIFPNPSAGDIYVQSPDVLKGFSLGFYDLQGRLLQTFFLQGSWNAVSLPHKAEGLYLLKAEAPGYAPFYTHILLR